MDMEFIIDAAMASIVIAVLVVVGICAIVYAVVKRKKNYDSTGIPDLVDDPKEKEGSTGPHKTQE